VSSLVFELFRKIGISWNHVFHSIPWNSNYRFIGGEILANFFAKFGLPRGTDFGCQNWSGQTDFGSKNWSGGPV